MGASYRFGIEEEFFLADATTRNTPGKSAKGFHHDVRKQVPDAERELMQSQIEIASKPTDDFAEARSALRELRSSLAEIGLTHRILLLAAGTHPVARWARQSHTKKERYAKIIREAQMVEQRNMVCGMHVHVEVPTPEDRVDLMNRMLPFMPVLLALSASSPFWEGRETGLAAYRLSVWGELPRTGLPDLFRDAADYDHYIATMVRSQVIPDASFLWWTLRPSIHYPTLELRVADSCTRLDDTLAIAALYRCLVRRVVRDPCLHREMTGASRAIASENLWRAQRWGVHGSFLDEEGGLIPFTVVLDRLIATLSEDAEALGCTNEVGSATRIVEAGTSADRQLAVFAEAQARGDSKAAALGAVVDWIANATIHGSEQGTG